MSRCLLTFILCLVLIKSTVVLAEGPSLLPTFLDMLSDCNTLLTPRSTKDYSALDAEPTRHRPKPDQYLVTQIQNYLGIRTQFTYSAEIVHGVFSQNINLVRHKKGVRSSLNAREEFERAVRALDFSTVNSAKGEWNEGNNHSQFFRQLERGKPVEKAALGTFTGRNLSRIGFRNVRQLSIGWNATTGSEKITGQRTQFSADDLKALVKFQRSEESDLLPALRNGPLVADWDENTSVITISDIAFGFQLKAKVSENSIEFLTTSRLEIDGYSSSFLTQVRDFLLTLEQVSLELQRGIRTVEFSPKDSFGSTVIGSLLIAIDREDPEYKYLHKVLEALGLRLVGRDVYGDKYHFELERTI